jgi:hypothetical protein
MCVDYIDLNKHCPKDPFGLPCIDEVVDSTAGCELLPFLDCYSGYYQISFKEDDQINTSFITPFGAYCYTTMSFRLKTLEPPINVLSNSASTTRYVMTLSRPTLMTLSSKLETLAL